MPDSDHLALARKLIELWNGGDIEGVLELYADDAVIRSQPEWPEPSWHGRDRIRQSFEEWRAVWESSIMELDRLESHGDRVVASGAWNTRGRASGIDGHMPFAITLSLRDGKIAALEWFADYDAALAAARDA